MANREKTIFEGVFLAIIFEQSKDILSFMSVLFLCAKPGECV